MGDKLKEGFDKGLEVIKAIPEKVKEGFGKITEGLKKIKDKFLSILKKFKWIIIITAVVGGILAIYFAIMMSPLGLMFRRERRL